MAKGFIVFDCEIANKFDGLAKICQFGYVKTDLDFNVIESKNIYINPGNKESFYNVEERGINLDYSENNYEYYYSQPTFEYFYEEIKALMLDKNYIKVAFSATNDLYYLNSEMVFHKLPQLQFECFDIQILYCGYYKTFNRIGVDKILERNSGNILFDRLKDYKRHNALNDSIIELELLKNIFTITGINYTFLAKNSINSVFVNSIKSYILGFQAALHLDFIRKNGKERIIDKNSKLVFFDIEEARLNNAFDSMCEFSYVVTDLELNELYKKEFIINPGSIGSKHDFNLVGREGFDDLHLKYENNTLEDKYFRYHKSAEFNFYANEISKLLNNPNNLCFGYSVGNDLVFLRGSYNRYKLIKPKLCAYDVQKLFKGQSLKKTIIETTNDSNYQETYHNALEDSLATLKALRYYVKENNITVSDLIKTKGNDLLTLSVKKNKDDTKLYIQGKIKDFKDKMYNLNKEFFYVYPEELNKKEG